MSPGTSAVASTSTRVPSRTARARGICRFASASTEAWAFRAWLVRIVYNSCRDRFRSRPPIPVSFDENTPFEQADNLPLQEALKSLPNDTRLSIVLYYLEGMKVSEVAQAQGVSEGTVKSRLSRGRTMLKGLLTEEEHENE